MSTVQSARRLLRAAASAPAAGAAAGTAAAVAAGRPGSVLAARFASSSSSSTARYSAAAAAPTTTCARRGIATTALAPPAAATPPRAPCAQSGGVRLIRTRAPQLAGHKVKTKKWLETVERYGGFMKPRPSVNFVVDVPEPALPTVRHSYFVERTKSKNLPVYRLIKGHATWTVVRKIEGDIDELAKELQAALARLCEADVAVDVLRGRMLLRVEGCKDDFIREWLTKKGF